MEDLQIMLRYDCVASYKYSILTVINQFSNCYLKSHLKGTTLSVKYISLYFIIEVSKYQFI